LSGTDRKVEAAVRKAWTLFEAKQLEKAIECFDEAIEADPQVASSWLEKGVCCFRVRHFIAALECFEQALARAPSSPVALVNRAKTLAVLGQRTAALAAFEAVLAITPDHPGALCGRGELLESGGDPAAALAAFQTAIDAHPREAEPWMRKGLAIWRHGGEAKREEALAALVRAVELRPKYAEAHHHRGRLLRALGRTKEAYRSLLEALKPEDAAEEWIDAAGDCALELGLAKDALACAERILKRSQDAAAGWRLKARAQDHVGNAASARLCAGMAFMVEGRLDSALAELNRALAYEPRYGAALSNKAVILERLKRPEEALATYDLALGLDPAAIPILMNKGNLLVGALGRREEGIRCFQKVVRIDPRKWFDLPSDIRQEVDRQETASSPPPPSSE
jgi:tetratricopeptide (TPR) repeat protein